MCWVIQMDAPGGRWWLSLAGQASCFPRTRKTQQHFPALQGLVPVEKTDPSGAPASAGSPRHLWLQPARPPTLPARLDGTRSLSLRSCSLSVWEPARIPTFWNDLGCSGARAQRKSGSSQER